MADRVLVSIEAGVADVRLNRPDKLNALDPATFAALVEAGESLKAQSSVRAVVLSGEGRAFCSGLDFSAFQSMADDTAPAAADESGEDEPVSVMSTDGRFTHLGQQAAWVWRELPVPVIAAISGPCLGGGLQIALGADLRIVAADAKLSVLEIRWGLIPDMTGTWILPRLVGPDVAKELTWTGRMVSGEVAVRIGLATRVAEDPRAAALELAGELAARSPVAVRHGKRLLDLSMSDDRTVADQFLDERRTMGSLIGSADNIEAVTAYFEKRAPVFPDVVD
jgi:enoyl-CoA hydratase/carnithine racemase